MPCGCSILPFTEQYGLIHAPQEGLHAAWRRVRIRCQHDIYAYICLGWLGCVIKRDDTRPHQNTEMDRRAKRARRLFLAAYGADGDDADAAAAIERARSAWRRVCTERKWRPTYRARTLTALLRALESDADTSAGRRRAPRRPSAAVVSRAPSMRLRSRDGRAVNTSTPYAVAFRRGWKAIARVRLVARDALPHPQLSPAGGASDRNAIAQPAVPGAGADHRRHGAAHALVVSPHAAKAVALRTSDASHRLDTLT